jgi:hypothetical protein
MVPEYLPAAIEWGAQRSSWKCVSSEGHLALAWQVKVVQRVAR